MSHTGMALPTNFPEVPTRLMDLQCQNYSTPPLPSNSHTRLLLRVGGRATLLQRPSVGSVLLAWDERGCKVGYGHACFFVCRGWPRTCSKRTGDHSGRGPHEHEAHYYSV